MLCAAGRVVRTCTLRVCLKYRASPCRRFYCPRDPGCITYDMSVHDVKVHAAGYSGSVKAEDLQPGHNITIMITGETTMTEVTAAMTYRVYALSGKNMAFGLLQDALTLSGTAFTLEATFELTSAAIGSEGCVHHAMQCSGCSSSRRHRTSHADVTPPLQVRRVGLRRVPEGQWHG